ncbi:hypothetical protein RFI_25344 [Reticulomyxa filosa]|uniref:Uncharacterized protein n=1 Tax=Reticulomyxa filosa TaxID=46433 RepID=X6MF42_RETFI|nr:hypothetical protein RFI_25344 [Reticulomyxa filosa]|eukprot:ETO12032.1 hypothetical protein RFI_25344 [Reticulomyxa filosa]
MFVFVNRHAPINKKFYLHTPPPVQKKKYMIDWKKINWKKGENAWGKCMGKTNGEKGEIKLGKLKKKMTMRKKSKKKIEKKYKIEKKREKRKKRHRSCQNLLCVAQNRNLNRELMCDFEHCRLVKKENRYLHFPTSLLQ